MARKTDYTGDRLGDWFVESKSPAVNGKRFWNCVNTVTDERAVVPQTALKSLGEGKYFPSTESFLGAIAPDCDNCLSACPADENCRITEDGKHDMSKSAEITARVVLGNYKDDPFNIPDGILPDDDSEYPFMPDFVEPIGTVTVTEDEFGVNAEFNVFEAGSDFFDDDNAGGGCGDFACSGNCEPNKIDHDLLREEAEAAELTMDDPPLPGGVRRSAADGSPWEPSSNFQWLRVAELARQLSDAICDAIEAQ